MTHTLNYVLDKLGFKTESFSKIQFGQGVIGRTWPIFLAAVIMLGLLGLELSIPWMQFIALVALIVLPCYYLHSVIRHTEKSPETALLEGATLIAYRQQELAAKGLPKPPEGPSVTNPTPSQPALSGDMGEVQ
ncbi:MAG TPA: hypothetical protein VMV79_01770 [Alphaproteobacteria bacterium]|nr:hypothetical protein [Alphaproteobacteria bacterium]